MIAGRSAAVVAALLAAATAGCGFGAGERSEGVAALTVTRDYGAEPVLDVTVEGPPASETVLRFLDREAELTTRYGGGFVQSIEGLEGGMEGGRRLDWFFYVNGVESQVGAAEVEVRAGDRVWWDYRDWTDAMRVPAVVGSWPQPLAGEVELRCLGERASCEAAAGQIEAEGGGVAVRRGLGGAAEGDAPRILVGPWTRVRRDAAAAQVEDGPATSGVFADFENEGAGYELAVLDETGSEVGRLGRGAGLVAAVRDGEGPPTWLVTGTDAAGVRAAAALLDEGALRDRYAVTTAPGRDEIPLPVVE